MNRLKIHGDITESLDVSVRMRYLGARCENPAILWAAIKADFVDTSRKPGVIHETYDSARQSYIRSHNTT
jgi:hypothetical protein